MRSRLFVPALLCAIIAACGNASADARRSICASGSRILQEINARTDLTEVADEIAGISGEEPKLARSERQLREASENIVLRYQQRHVSASTDSGPILEAAQRLTAACAK